MELWVGPAIVAALVSAIVSVIGWIVTFNMSLRMEQMRRDEKVHDFQVALRAEIESDLLNLQVGDRREMLDGVARALAADPAYHPLVPRLARNLVFEQIVKEVHLLPGNIIGTVVHYERLRQSAEYFVDDIRAADGLDADRRLLMVSDYFEMLDRLELLALNAKAALDQSLALSRPDAAPPNPESASGAGRASASESALP